MSFTTASALFVALTALIWWGLLAWERRSASATVVGTPVRPAPVGAPAAPVASVAASKARLARQLRVEAQPPPPDAGGAEEEPTEVMTAAHLRATLERIRSQTSGG